MIGNQRLKLGRANFAGHPMSHQNQNWSFDGGSRLDRRIMRDVANRAGRVRASRVMMRES